MLRGVRMRHRARRRGALARYLGPDEQVLLSTRQHPVAVVRGALDSLVLLLPLAIAAWGISGVELLRGAPGTWLLTGVFGVMFVLVLRMAWRVLGWEFERIVITDEKVIHLAGVLNRRIASTPLSKVSEFTVRQPVIGRMLDYGSLVVDVPGGREQALHGIHCLPDPAGVYRLVSEQARRGRSREGGGRVEASATRLDARMPMPSAADVAAASRPDPWQPTLDGDLADHTIAIPRIPPPSA